MNSFGNITIKRVRSYILLNYGRLASNSGRGWGEDQENSEDVWVGGRVTITLATGLYKSLPAIPQAREITSFKLRYTCLLLPFYSPESLFIGFSQRGCLMAIILHTRCEKLIFPVNGFILRCGFTFPFPAHLPLPLPD